MERIQTKWAIASFPVETVPAPIWALHAAQGRDAWVPLRECVGIADTDTGRELALEFGCLVGRVKCVRRVVAEALRRWRGRVPMQEVVGGETAYDNLVSCLEDGLPSGGIPDDVVLLRDRAQARRSGEHSGTRVVWPVEDAANALVMEYSLTSRRAVKYAYWCVLRGLAAIAEFQDPLAVTARAAWDEAKEREKAVNCRVFDWERSRSPWAPPTPMIRVARAARLQAQAAVARAQDCYFAAKAAVGKRRQEIDAQYAALLGVLG